MNSQEYLRDACKIICDNFRSDDPTGGMTVASAAYLVKRVVGDHRDVGFPKFKDVLTALASEGRLRTGKNSKDAFSLWLTEGASTPATPAQSSDRFRPLRKPVWFAFVASEPSGDRFLHKLTGEVRVGCSAAPGESWVEIRPIPPDADRQETRNFLKENGIEEAEFAGVIERERWYVIFPQQLAAKSPHLAAVWKRERSSRVIDYVKKWCEESDIDQELVFESIVPALPPSTTRLAQSTRNFGQENDDLRNVLLDAIQQMSTDELLRISIPPLHLINRLRPDLLR